MTFDPYVKLTSSKKTRAEVNKIRRACFLKAINLSIFFVASRILVFVSFIVYVLLGNVLTSEAVFVTMSLLNTLRLTMTLFFPQAIGYGAELKITCSRIQNFLMLEEMQTNWGITQNGTKCKDKGAKGNESPKVGDESISWLSIKNITANWTKEQNRATLKNISVDVCPGELLAVIGPVGSGKVC